MFIAIVLITSALAVYLTLRERVLSPQKSARRSQKQFKSASQKALSAIQVLRGTRRFEEALRQVADSARTFPEELLFRLEEGLILLELDRPEEALEAFKVCAPIMRTESDMLALASALNRAGHSTQAFDLLKPWISGTRNGELLFLVGDTYFARKQFSEAIHFYDQAIQLGHKTHLLFTQLAHAYRRLGNLAESESIFRRLLEKNSADLIATLGLGLCMQERGHFQKALLIYQSCGAWEQKDPRLLKEAGLCALRTKKYAYAEAYLFEVIQNADPEPALFASYALALEHQNKWQEAEQVYLKLIQLFPSYPHGYRALAWMFGVGIACTLSPEQGTRFAHIALKLKNDLISWEILSACEARVGNFERAYYIQMQLVKEDRSREMKIRRQQALRNLRKQHPLDGHHVTRSLVA